MEADKDDEVGAKLSDQFFKIMRDSSIKNLNIKSEVIQEEKENVSSSLTSLSVLDESKEETSSFSKCCSHMSTEKSEEKPIIMDE